MRHAIILLLAFNLACANHPESARVEDPDDGSSTAVADLADEPHACGASELDECVDDDDIVICTKAAIKYEYEMLDARKHGRHAAFECYRDTLVSLLDHACDLGDDQACGESRRVSVAKPPA